MTLWVPGSCSESGLILSPRGQVAMLWVILMEGLLLASGGWSTGWPPSKGYVTVLG